MRQPSHHTLPDAGSHHLFIVDEYGRQPSGKRDLPFAHLVPDQPGRHAIALQSPVKPLRSGLVPVAIANERMVFALLHGCINPPGHSVIASQMLDPKRVVPSRPTDAFLSEHRVTPVPHRRAPLPIAMGRTDFDAQPGLLSLSGDQRLNLSDLRAQPMKHPVVLRKSSGDCDAKHPRFIPSSFVSHGFQLKASASWRASSKL